MKLEKQVGKKAFNYHKAGFHCAEAVSKAVVETYSQGTSQDIPKVATAFGGGVIGRRKVSRFSQLLNQNKLTLLSSNNLLI